MILHAPLTKSMKELRLAGHFSTIDSSVSPVEHLRAIRHETDVSFTNLMESRRTHKLVSKIAIFATGIAVASEYMGFDRTAKAAGIIAGLTLLGTAATAKSSENFQEIHETIENSAQAYANSRFHQISGMSLVNYSPGQHNSGINPTLN